MFTKKLSLVLSLLTLIIFTTNIAQANSQKIAVVDVEEILKNSLAMSNIDEQMGRKEKLYQGEIDKKKVALEQKAANIESKKAVMSEDALRQESKLIMQEFSQIKNDAEKKQKSLKQSYLVALSKIDKKIKEILDQISAEKNIDIILPSSGLAFYQDHLDISAEVLKKLNKELKTVKIHFK